jgi:methylmalonyl-CoA mutase
VNFRRLPPQQWEEKIIEDLKGADYDKKLVWKTPEGISVKPYYRSEHISNLPYLGSYPGHYPFVRGNKTKDNAWEIRQCVEVSNISEANNIALDALAKGATALSLDVSEVESASNLVELLNNIHLEKTDIHFFGSRNYPLLLNQLVDVCKKTNFDIKQLSGSFDFDPISYLLLHGDFYHHESVDFGQAFDLIKLGGKTAPEFRFISINGHYFHNSGGNIIQELAFAMASASEYVALLAAKGLTADEVLPRLNFILSSGSNYFMEIAKFRAARLLWARVAEQYSSGDKNAMKAYVHAITSNWNKTVYDPYVNMLRTTTEAMAAAVAGVDSITVNPFDTQFKEADNFSRRIARNQQILLKEEVYLDKVIDPAAGSYYIEQLTESLATHAWDLFVKVEQMGGMTQAVKDGFVQDELEKNAAMPAARMWPPAARCCLEPISSQTRTSVCLKKFRKKSLNPKQKKLKQPIKPSTSAVPPMLLKICAWPPKFLLTPETNSQRFLCLRWATWPCERHALHSAVAFLAVPDIRSLINAGFKTVEEGVEAVKAQKPESLLFVVPTKNMLR